MKKMANLVRVLVLAAFATVLISGPIYAAFSDCFGPDSKYPNLSTDSSTEYPVRCTSIPDPDDSGGRYITLYGKTSGDCAQAGVLANDPDSCNGDDLNNVIQTIINTVIFVVGMVAVVMIILGGVSYATSQGDTQKVKKGKDTILYGIIGLVIAILAFAIVNFVLSALVGGGAS